MYNFCEFTPFNMMGETTCFRQELRLLLSPSLLVLIVLQFLKRIEMMFLNSVFQLSMTLIFFQSLSVNRNICAGG